MRQLLKKMFGRKAAPVPVRHLAIDADDDLAWLHPPDTVTDSGAWDLYWQNQISHGTAGFIHLFVDDGTLVDILRANGLRRVLCVGNGVSQEPRALARAGLDVTSLDISPLAAKVASEAQPSEEFLARLVGGRLASTQGRLTFAVGDVCDPLCCPGPFDAIIERKTLQLWPEADRPLAIEAVARRLASPGIFFSQCHDGRWRPPAPPQHLLRPWFVSNGWEFWAPEMRLIRRRIAWLFTTTG